MGHPVRLGAFYLQDPIGQGGAGAVWRGVHLQQGIAVAVKVLSSERAREPRALASFRREVRAIARLNHDAIVSVLDYGVIPPAAAYESRGRLVAGSPYFVMELAESTLADQHPRPTWSATKTLLTRLLDALAHAHARGIVHRDLKPANALWVRRYPHHPPALKLGDFGLAHVIHLDEGEARGVAAGTPAYMAPEQFRGAVRDFGPWTDLYALGCVAYQLSSGHRAFVAETEEGYAQAHLRAPPPPLTPLHPVPDGFEGWVHRLLAKSPMERFHRAADAKWALELLGDVADPETDAAAGEAGSAWGASEQEPTGVSWTADEEAQAGAGLETADDHGFDTIDGDHGAKDAEEPSGSGLHTQPERAPLDPSRSSAPPGRSSAPPGRSSAPPGRSSAPPGRTGTFATGSRSRVSTSSRDGTSAESGPGPETSSPSTVVAFAPDEHPDEYTLWKPSSAPPLPGTWHTAAEAMPMTLLGAGLGLYGVREMPLVGREHIRNLMWDALRLARDRGRPRVLLLEGPSGYGKTHLATWFAQRAHEVGSAEVLVSKHEHGDEPGDALIRMARDRLKVAGMHRSMVRARVRRTLQMHGAPDGEEAEALVALVAPTRSRQEPEPPRVVQPAARFALLLRTLQRACRERPAIVVFDDVQWDALTLYFTEYALDYADGEFPVVFVLVAQEEALAERPVERELLGMMRERDDVEGLRIGPLAEREHRGLVANLLRLESDLADDIARRTAGNPLFATQLVGDWVDRGVLEVSKRGFVLRSGVSVDLPDDLYEVWTARVDRAVRDVPDGRVALELAAVFGRVVPVGEWTQACTMMRLDVPPDFLQSMLRAQLVETDDRLDDGVPRFAFVHGMLREALERSARERDVLPHLHGAVADVLRPEISRGRVEVAERLASHLRAANRLREAVHPLRIAADVRRRRGEFERATALLEVHSRILVDIEAAPGHSEWTENLLMHADILCKQGAFSRAMRTANEAADHARRGEIVIMKTRADYIGAYLEVQKGHLEAAEPTLYASAQTFDLLGLRVDSARALRALGDIARLRGDRSVAFGVYLTSLEACRAYDDVHGAAESLAGMGVSDPQEPDGNTSMLYEALELFEHIGDLFGVASTLSRLGDVTRRRSVGTDAEGLYRRAIAICQRIGASYLEANAVLGMALAQIDQGRYEAALRALDVAWRVSELLGHEGVIAALHGASLPCSVFARDAPAWEEHVARLEEHVNDEVPLPLDVVTAIELAGDRSAECGNIDHAETAWLLASRYYDAAGAEDRAARAREKATS